MSSRSYWRAERALCALLLCAAAGPLAAGTPQWLQELAGRPVPEQKAEVDAVQLLSEVEVEVRADGRIRKHMRAAWRILRPAGEARATFGVTYDPQTRIVGMQVWTIAADGREFEVGMKDATDASIDGVTGADMITDVRSRYLRAPNARVGSVIGFENTIEMDPRVMQDVFGFQGPVPVLEARYSLQVPARWEVRPSWLNHAPVEPVRPDERSWQWTLRDLPAVVEEPFMPSLRGVAAQLQVSFARAGETPELGSWEGIAGWYARLARDRLKTSAGMRARIAELTKGRSSFMERFRALAAFVQSDIRYVAIELGIGGYQPRSAPSVFENRFGDCKDKVTLLAVMLAEVGIPSVPVLVNMDRSVVAPDTPPGLLFNHVILAVPLPADVPVDGLLALGQASDGGPLLYFDPTDEVTPVGRLSGALQDSWGLRVEQGTGVLAQLPRIAPAQSGVQRTATLALAADGTLSGTIIEHMVGDVASQDRSLLRTATRDADLVEPVKARLAESMPVYRIQEAQASNRTELAQPFEWRYSFESPSYGQRAGELLTLRPRVVGRKADPLPESDTPRMHELEFREARLDRDEILIQLPAGYVVDAVPDPVDLDVGFAAYRSRTEVAGNALKYTRTYELRELRIPASQAGEYRRLHQAIARDERAVAVLKSSAAK